MVDYKLVNAKTKDIELLTSIKMVTMLDDELDKKLSFEEKEKVKNNISINIEQSYKDYKIIYVDKEIAGTYAVIPYEDGKMIDEIYLFPEFRNKGIGSDIVKKIVPNCRYLYIWLNKNNKDAIKWIEKLGFKEVSKGRTVIYRFDYLFDGVLSKLNLKYGYRDKFGKRFIEPNKKFKEEYYLQSPEEVLSNGYGFVFDQVELIRKLIGDIGLDLRTYFMIYNSSDNEMSHAFLVYKDMDKYYWLENTWIKYKGIHEYDDKESLLMDVVKKFIGTIKDGDERKLRLYQFNKPSYGISYNKYVRNCMNGISINIFRAK